ncbi:hypothetical protein NL676_033895 [Syzygium grande]|nr:hypothetical protein NL676_033895 [Syzygium grande]
MEYQLVTGGKARSLRESQRPVQTKSGHSSWTSSTATNGSWTFLIATGSMARMVSPVACDTAPASPSHPKALMILAKITSSTDPRSD